MHCWHDVSKERITSTQFLSLIEISKGSKNKYELDLDTGHLILDRVLSTSTHYPQNYGFIPLTYALDDDPLDVLVLSSEGICPMTYVDCSPIGVVSMTDGGVDDDKIIAVASHDPFYNGFKDIDDLPNHVLDEIKHFFEIYKTLEGKKTSVHVIKNRKCAIRIIEQAIDRYKKEIVPYLVVKPCRIYKKAKTFKIKE